MKKVWERIVPFSIAQVDREWDIKFWQAQSPEVRFRTAIKMLKDFYRMRGKKIDADKFRLQRSIENIKQA